MEIGMSIGLGRHPALDVYNVLVLGQAVEVKFHRQRCGIIVPMPDKEPLSQQQFREIVELIAREGQIGLEIISDDDVHINRAITQLQELGVLEPHPQESDEEQMSTEEMITQLEEMGVSDAA